MIDVNKSAFFRKGYLCLPRAPITPGLNRTTYARPRKLASAERQLERARAHRITMSITRGKAWERSSANCNLYNKESENVKYRCHIVPVLLSVPFSA